jgi:uncharacterized membrane protein YhaH (DUF805 family)
MRIVLKFLAALIWWPIAGTVLLIWRFSHLGSLGTLAGNGVFGVATVLGWVFTLALGPVAAIQLWRLRESGRRLSLFLSLFALIYYVVSWMHFRNPNTDFSKAGLAVFGNAVFSAILFSPQARRVCRSSHSRATHVN